MSNEHGGQAITWFAAKNAREKCVSGRVDVSIKDLSGTGDEARNLEQARTCIYSDARRRGRIDA